MERRLLLDVVVGQRAALLQLLPGEDQTLLVRRDPYTGQTYIQRKFQQSKEQLTDAIT